MPSPLSWPEGLSSQRAALSQERERNGKGERVTGARGWGCRDAGRDREHSTWACIIQVPFLTPRNKRQETALLVQFVLKMRFLAFDFAGVALAEAQPEALRT
eukprot:2641233-Rhodomonas_salina.1